jgi:acetolactate synthase-1/2/3 large subunit
MRSPDRSRREFLRQAAAGAAGAAAAGVPAAASTTPQPSPVPPPPQVPTAATRAAETSPPPEVDVLTTGRPGSDFMVDVIKSLGFEYICANPGSTFRSLQESIVNYGGNKKPEFITCTHEEAAVAIAHGYFKVEGKPLAALLHSNVGLQHAAMAIYNAFCDRVPVYLIVANALDATQRRPGVEWLHSVPDVAGMVRDFVKWDDIPVSLPHFAESAVRAYKIAMTPPMMPVLIVADSELQEAAVDQRREPHVLRITSVAPPQGDSGAVAEIARLLVAAEAPVIVADRAVRSAEGMKQLVELAETLQAPVLDQYGRLNFPTRHPLNHSENARTTIAAADVVLGLELTDFWGLVNTFRDQQVRTSRRIARSGVKLAGINSNELFAKGNSQDVQRYAELDIAVAADAEATLPSLIEAIRKLATGERRRVFQARGAEYAKTRQRMLEQARAAAAYGWDASPISTARLCAELWGQIRNEDWALVSEINFASSWPLRLWDFTRHYQFIGGAGGYGVGYGAPASVGAALAHKNHGRISVSVQNDGDLMYSPGVLWTAAHHRIPLLSVMHNNRAYHQETMHVQRMAARHERGITRASIGTTLEDPNIDYAKVAQGLGVHGEGPITNPDDLGPAIFRALAVVKSGRPALVDVVTQPR